MFEVTIVSMPQKGAGSVSIGWDVPRDPSVFKSNDDVTALDVLSSSSAKSSTANRLKASLSAMKAESSS